MLCIALLACSAVSLAHNGLGLSGAAIALAFAFIGFLQLEPNSDGLQPIVLGQKNRPRTQVEHCILTKWASC